MAGRGWRRRGRARRAVPRRPPVPPARRPSPRRDRRRCRRSPVRAPPPSRRGERRARRRGGAKPQASGRASGHPRRREVVEERGDHLGSDGAEGGGPPGEVAHPEPAVAGRGRVAAGRLRREVGDGVDHLQALPQRAGHGRVSLHRPSLTSQSISAVTDGRKSSGEVRRWVAVSFSGRKPVTDDR